MESNEGQKIAGSAIAVLVSLASTKAMRSVAAEMSEKDATAKVVREAGLATGAVPPEPHFADTTRRDFDARA